MSGVAQRPKDETSWLAEMQIFYPGMGAPAPLPVQQRPPLRTMQPEPFGRAGPKPIRGLGSSGSAGSAAADSSRTRAALAGSALEGTLNPDPASPARLEARLADAAVRPRGPAGGGAGHSPYGALDQSGQARQFAASRLQQHRAPRASQAQRASAAVQRPSQRGQPRARFPSQFPVHQQVHHPSRGKPQHAARSFGQGPRGFAPPHSSHLHFQQPISQLQQHHLAHLQQDAGPPPRTAERPMTGQALDSEEYQAAFSELDELRGLTTLDADDERRFEAAARPSTAPSAPRDMDVPQEYLQATAHVRPGTSAGRPETEEELRVRLLAAESVMRKLYRRNSQLEDECKQRPSTSSGVPPPAVGDASSAVASPSRPQTSGAGAGPGAGPGSPSKSPSKAGAGGDGGDDEAAALSGADEHALYLLRQKEADLHRMKEYTSGLQAQLTEATALAQGRWSSDDAAAAASAAAADANSEYRERYLRMRGEYRQLLRSRADSLKRSGHVSMEREQATLLNQLEMALQDEADLHRKESQRLNEELYLQEKRSCDWYVEKRLLEQKMSGMEAELAQRDELDGEIENKMVALFSRLKQLEDANLQLEQTNEALQSKAVVASE